MHDASSKVPMIVRKPKLFEGNMICDEPTNLVDVMPTIMSAAGIDTTEIELDGRDLKKIAVGKCDREAVFSQFGSGQKGIYMIATKDFKYFYSAADDKEFLFDKINDPDEQRNAAGNTFYFEKQNEIKNKLLEYLKSTGMTDAFEEKDEVLSWKKYPNYYGVTENPDDGLLIQDAPESIVKIEGY